MPLLLNLDRGLADEVRMEATIVMLVGIGLVHHVPWRTTPRYHDPRNAKERSWRYRH